MIKIKIFVLLIIAILFTGCASFLQKDGYYTGEKAIKKDHGIVLSSVTVNSNVGSALYVSISLVNIETGEKIDLENKICRIKKDSPGMGPLAQLFIEDKPDQIDLEGRCGSLLVGEVQSGKYLIKSISITSVNNAVGGYASTMSQTLKEKKTVEIKDSQIVYIGNVDANITFAEFSFLIYNGTISMINNYERDEKVFKRDYPLLKKTIVKDSSIVLKVK